MQQHLANMGDGRVNGVAILDAIPEGELNTARRLREDLRDISTNFVDGLQVRYVHVDTIASLEAGISSLLDEAKTNGLRPWLHLEGHGFSNEDGFLCANGEHCSWNRLKEIITPLNVSTGLNLVLILATCYGGSFARAIQTVDRSPVLGLIGPTREVKTRQLETGFPAFYRTFFETLSLKKAINALNETAPKNLYYRTTAERFFYDVWAGYKKTHCSKQEIANRARRMYRKAKSQDLPKTPSVGQLKRLIRGKERDLFEKYRDAYFMYDIHRSNRTRFPVTYEEAEAYASR
ncbi:MAG: hypothetical protein Tsb0026_17870 [Sulfuricaulis sp.]